MSTGTIPITLTAEQLLEAHRAILEVIDVPLPVCDQDESAQRQILVCRVLAASAFLESMFGVGDESPMADFEVWLAHLRESIDDYPTNYMSWKDVDSGRVSFADAQAAASGVFVSPGPTTNREPSWALRESVEAGA